MRTAFGLGKRVSPCAKADVPRLDGKSAEGEGPERASPGPGSQQVGALVSPGGPGGLPGKYNPPHAPGPRDPGAGPGPLPGRPGVQRGGPGDAHGCDGAWGKGALRPTLRRLPPPGHGLGTLLGKGLGSLRQAEALPGLRAPLPLGLGPFGGGPEHGLARPGPDPPGPWRRGGSAPHLHACRRALPHAGAGQGAGVLQRGLGDLRPPRPHPGRAHRHLRLLALGLLPQPPLWPHGRLPGGGGLPGRLPGQGKACPGTSPGLRRGQRPGDPRPGGGFILSPSWGFSSFPPSATRPRETRPSCCPFSGNPFPGWPSWGTSWQGRPTSAP